MGMMGGQDHGGFNNLLSSLTSSGLADQAKSWISTNANQLISGQQVASWLGPDKLKQLAQATGLNPSDVADHLAKQLPAVIDKLTPMARCLTKRVLRVSPGRLAASSSAVPATWPNHGRLRLTLVWRPCAVGRHPGGMSSGRR